jgi:peptidoglycan/xylan/chitin deacetylase (PgdA/CDA1 family)
MTSWSLHPVIWLKWKGAIVTKKDEFYIAFQIDCEATQHAVNDASLGWRSSEAFADILESNGLLGTFFVIPTDIEACSSLYLDLNKRGHEVGLHVHPADMGYEEFLGVYGYDKQKEILGLASDKFAQVMGYRPDSICVGYAAANDYTFPVMSELGFKHGMLSIPTRILPQCTSVWAGAPLDIHYVNAYNRILPGKLDLVNVPLTIDPDSRMWGGAHPQDLRIELVDAKNHWYTIKKEVDRKIKINSPVKYILALTHNTFDYGKEFDFRRETLIKLIDHAKNIINSLGYQMVGATMKQVAEDFRAKCPLDKISEFKLKLDTSGRS